MKKDQAFTLANYMVLGKINQIRTGKASFLDKKTRILLRKFNHIRETLINFTVRLDKFKDEILNGQIQYYAEPADKGGDLKFTITGDKDTVEAFCNYRLRDKASMVTLRPIMEIKRNIHYE